MITLKQLEAALPYMVGIDAQMTAEAVRTRLIAGVDGNWHVPKNTLGLIARACQVECHRGPVNWSLTFVGDGCTVIIQSHVVIR